MQLPQSDQAALHAALSWSFTRPSPQRSSATVLNMAATNNKVEAMRLLIAGGADIHAPDKAIAHCKSPHKISIDGLRLQRLFSSCKQNTNISEDLKITRSSLVVM